MSSTKKEKVDKLKKGGQRVKKFINRGQPSPGVSPNAAEQNSSWKNASGNMTVEPSRPTTSKSSSRVKVKPTTADEAARSNRLTVLRKLGLYPADKDPFSKQDMEYLEIEGLWSKFLKTLSNEMSITTSGLMKSIVAVFNPMYSHWSDEFELDGVFRSDVIRKSFYIPIADQHSANCIISIYQTFIISVVDAIRDGNTCHNLKGLEIISLVNILTRVDENRAVLRSNAILNQIISLIKMVLVKIKEPFATNTKNLENPCDVESIYIQVLLGNCYQIVMNYISFMWCWREDLSEVCSASKETVMEDTKSELLKQGLLKIIKGYLDHLSSVSSKQQLAGSQDDFMWLLVNCVGALLRRFEPAKEQLVHTGIIEILLGCIGWPTHLLEDGSYDVTAATNPKLREEFKRQLLCLQTLHQGVQGNPTNARKISALGGWEKIMDLILWATEVFSINPFITRAKLLAGTGRGKANVTRWNSANKRAAVGRDDLMYPSSEASPSPSEKYGFMHFDENRAPSCLATPEPQLLSRTRELEILFNLLFSICMGGTSTETLSAVAKGNQSSQGTDLSKINRVVVNIIIDLFNVDIRQSAHNVRVRTKLKTEYCELQMVVLQFIVRMVEKSPVATILCRRYRLWDALFSDSFFYCGLDEGITASPSMQEKDELRGGIFSSLRAYTMLVLEFLAVTDEHDNIDEIHKVLELLDTYHNEPSIILQVSRTLITILQHNLIQTQKSLARLNALPIVGIIIEEQQQETASYLSVAEDDDLRHQKETFFRARYSVLALLTHMLARNDEMIYNTINDSRIVDVVFSLLFEPEMRRYAIAQTVQLMAVKIDAKHNADNSELLKLYDQYFKLFRRAQAGTLPTSFKLLLQLLEGVRTVIERNARTQRLFKDVGAFLNITNVLNAEEHPDRIGVVCLEVLKTIASLMKGNQKNRDHMRTNIGYDTLRRLILRALSLEHESTKSTDESNKEPLATQLVPLLFDMLVDGRFDIVSHYTIANPDIVTLMFGIINELPPSIALDMLRTFTQIVEKCPLNQNLCCAQHLIHHLLGMISELKKDMEMMSGIVSLIEVLGTHSITVKELKRLFLLLKSEEGDFRHVAQTILMKALQFMALSRSLSPASFFDLDGRTGALVLPPLEKFPSNHGYTFSIWFRVESFSDPTDKPHYQSRLASFLDENGMGIELYFTASRSSHLDKSYHLTHTVCSTSGKTASTTFTQFFFKENRWYLMTLTHSNHRKFRIGDSESKLFINGELKQKLALKYPQLPPVLTRAMFCNNVEVRSPVRKILRRNPFFGQLGPVMVFDDQLSASQVQFVFNLFAENTANDSGTSCFGELESKIVLYYNSTARVAKYYLDLSPEKNRERRLDAKQVGGIFPCVTRDVKDIIHCLGGIKVLLPLFAQLDQPLAPSSPGEEIDYTTDTQYILQALALLGDMLSKSDTNERELERCQGFPIIGFLLERAVPEHFTSETLVTLEDFLHKVQYEPLIDDLWKNIICNWHIWIYANPNVQWELAEMITNAVKSQRSCMMRTHTVQDLLDVLYFFYWYQPKGIKLRAQDPVYHPVTKKLVGQRPNPSELAIIRKSLFNAIYAMVMSSTSDADASAVLGAVIEAADDQQAGELLDFSLKLLSSNQKFKDHVESMDGMQVFIMMLRNDQESIRITSLRVIALLSLSLRPRDQLNVFLSVAKLLSEYPLTKPLYHALFDIMIGVSYNPSQEKGGRLHFTIDENVKIRTPTVLHVILTLVCKADLWLHQSVLQDLYLLLSNSSDNREAVCQLPGWQGLLFTVLLNTKLPKGLAGKIGVSPTLSPVDALSADAEGDSDAAAAESSGVSTTAGSSDVADAKIVHEITYNIFKTLLMHSFSSEKLGHRVLHHTLSLLTWYDCTGALDRVHVTRTIFAKVLGSMQSTARTQVTGGSSSKRKDSIVAMASAAKEVDLRNLSVLTNVLHFIALVEEFLYYTPSTTELHLLQKGRSRPTDDQHLFDMTGTVTASTMHYDGSVWEDLDLARKFLDTLDLLHLLDNKYAAQIDQIAKEAGKNAILRPGGISRIALRVAATVIREGDIKACVETVPRIRAMLGKDLKSSKVEASRSVQFVFSSLLLTLQNSLNRVGGGSSAAGSAKSKAIVPLMKDLLRACLSILPQGSDDKQLLYFCESGTIREFTESFNTPRWTSILNWAEQQSAAFSNEASQFIPAIEKARSKQNQATLQMISRDEKQEAANESKVMAGFQQVHEKILQPEIERKRKVALQADVKRIAVQRQWRRILRSLTNERAPWGESSADEEIFWKLDKTENFARMRVKLKRNYDFDPHTGAAREQAQLSGTDQGEASKNEEENQLKIFSGMKLAAVGEKEEDLSELKLNDEDVAALLADESEEKKEAAVGQKEEKLVTSVYCELVTPMKLIVGRCDLTTTHIYFFEERAEDTSAPAASETELLKEVKIPLDQLREVHLRRYLLRRSAIEVFLIDRSNYFLNFKRRERNKVYKEIISLSPPNLSYFETGSPEQILRKSDLTRRWQLRKISNFDYLIELNKIAGRTYNDLTQYPVFPWILADYESDSIDLNDPSIYRDLSKPVGALNPKRLEMFIARYESFVDPDIPSFHYGSHYSSSGIVLFYLIRTEPFTTHFLQLQGGKFDHADRMFCSIPKCWSNCLNSSADVKELIPEFFYFPDMFVNSNNFNLGMLQDGSSLNHVELPKWASSPEEFVRINRAALESDYVSAKLHLWIDLIFGFKQRGRDAIEAANVFYYLTYEGAVDIDAIEDEDKRKATVAQIDNFGQTPAQLLRKNHPQRLALQDSHQDLCVRIGVGKLTPKLFSLTINNNTDPLVYVCMPNHYFRPVAGIDVSNDDKLITVTETRLAACHKFTTTSPSPAQPFTFEADPLATSRRKVGVPFAADLAITSSCFACSSDGKMVLSCGHWDYSIKCSWLDNSRPPQSLREHKDLVTCLALGADGRTFVTGSKDTTILVWEILYLKGSPSRVSEKPKHILYGHNDDVTCVAVDIGLDVCVSGSNDGTCIIHNLRQGDYVRSLYHPKALPITLVAISTVGHVVFYSQDDRLLHLYNINGQFFKSIDVHERLQHIYITSSGEYLITGSSEGVITIRQFHDYPATHVLKVIQKIPTKSRVCSMTMSPDETYLLAGLEDGRLLSLSVQEKVRQPAARQPAGQP